MKKYYILIAIILFIIVGIFFFSTGGKAEITNFPPKKGNVIAFGDSLVSGVGSEYKKNFVSLLSEKLNTPIINKGVIGDTTRSALIRLEKDVLNEDPSIVFILLGGNDFLRQYDSDETFKNLEIIINRIQEKGAIVVLLGVQNSIIRNKAGKRYKKLSKEYGTVYVPNVLDGLIGHSEYMSDAIHPNDIGYKIISEKIYPHIIDLFSM